MTENLDCALCAYIMTLTSEDYERKSVVCPHCNTTLVIDSFMDGDNTMYYLRLPE